MHRQHHICTHTLDAHTPTAGPRSFSLQEDAESDILAMAALCYCLINYVQKLGPINVN